MFSNRPGTLICRLDRGIEPLSFLFKKNVILYGICYDPIIASYGLNMISHIMVGDRGFEPLTSCAQGTRTTKLC